MLLANFSPVRRRWKYVLLIGGLIILIFCLARPQFGTHMVMVKKEGQDVALVIDVSNSMMAEDMKPNRLEKAKQEVRGLLSRLEGDRVALIAFAGASFIQCPLTVDYSAAAIFLDVIDVDLIPQQGTNLADAISTATSVFNEKERKHKVMILITDGEDFGEGVEAVVEEAKLQGVRIFCIGLGHPDGEPIPIRNSKGDMVGYKKDQQGDLVLTKLNDVALRSIASQTNGKFYHASAGEIELESIYNEISGMEGKEQEGRMMTQYEDRYQYILPFALLALSLEVLISERRNRRRNNS